MLLTVATTVVAETPEEFVERMAWWKDAKYVSLEIWRAQKSVMIDVTN